MKGTYGWAAIDDTYGIKPGNSLDGFKLTSYGLPGIREIIVEPDINIDRLPEEYEENLEKTKALKEKFKWATKTVGPMAPPKEFKPLAFIDYTISRKHDAATLGWIRNEEIIKSLDAKLENAKKKLEQGSPGAAKNLLNAFINEVEAQGCATYENCPPGKHLTSEAYALLKYNAQYLIDNLSK